MVPIVIGAIGTVSKELEKELKQLEIWEILRRVQEIWGYLMLLKLQWKLSLLTYNNNNNNDNSEPVLEKETHKIEWDLEMKTVHQISARQPDQVIVKKKKKKKKKGNMPTTE